jgi:hypothetical protein
LKDLEVLQVCVLSIDVELDPRHGYIEIDTVKDLAESRTVFAAVLVTLRQPGVNQEGHCAGKCFALPSSTLLNLGDIQL